MYDVILYFIIFKIIFIKNVRYVRCGLNPVTNIVFNFVTKFILDFKTPKIYYLNFIEHVEIYIRGRTETRNGLLFCIYI